MTVKQDEARSPHPQPEPDGTNEKEERVKNDIKNRRENSLVRPRRTPCALRRAEREERAPHAREALVEPELLPHLEALLAAERAALDQPVHTPVRVPVLVAVLVEPASVASREYRRRSTHTHTPAASSHRVASESIEL